MSRKGEQGESKYFALAQSTEMLILFFVVAQSSNSYMN